MPNQMELDMVHSDLSQALNLIKNALDISMPYLDNEQKGAVLGLWQEFFGKFFRHINKKGNETGYNLFSLISLISLNR